MYVVLCGFMWFYVAMWFMSYVLKSGVMWLKVICLWLNVAVCVKKWVICG